MIVLNVTSSEITSLLLSGGKTTHSQFYTIINKWEIMFWSTW